MIADPTFGERMTTFVVAAPVWVVDSPLNRAVVERYRAASNAGERLPELTLFRGDLALTGAEIALGILHVIAEHHGEYSGAVMTQLTALGAEATAEVRAACVEFGVPQVVATTTGFVATAP